MNNQNNIIDWSSPDILLELVHQIKDPLTAIMEANKGVADQLFGNSNSQNASEITLENSQRIASLIEEVIRKTTTSQEADKQPLIFELYATNPHIQEMCNGVIDPKKISQTDKEWLLELESVVFNEAQLNQLSLFALAFEVSVSERQLHRNIKKFLALTPNKYIRILKLHKAKQLLEEYVYRTISEVAYAVGFSDVHYFSKLFFKQYGTMPKELLPS
ncbi:helix-turn-helix transcriptional regulator [uncultured Dokdonia sp.]|uniref:helix-turn-helix transcriptional regulator n=1 Tax=uncultured Dokdonia sp. TaxID=575653 RepID=UPI00262E9592|nr:helix-turn-helix transcriptional regulator [uncultured Dokdonia sp.]